ncbi:hypothetical protein P3T76_006565 [Phytophthora citrophthora]|uniref:Crinkler effector protein N-terminal domain-containing protein n=1 Tax=Phytophthora citrophthora TaxID=4793 RepID=A0AAD9GQ85_9STRA|nr:hypothetical protein P3T76_006565 [Phytophthora citrophthora]
MMHLGCVLLGEEGKFSVAVDPILTVSDLRWKIYNERLCHYAIGRNSNIQLYLAKTPNGEWMTPEDAAVARLSNLESLEDYGTSVRYKNKTFGHYQLSIEDVSEDFEVGKVHILVKIPEVRVFCVGKYICPFNQHDTSLETYDRVGEIIQRDCGDYSEQILTKIEEMYQLNTQPYPFICVQGSSGVGKTQLAFALNGCRPWFYSPMCEIHGRFQGIYLQFVSLSARFREARAMDLYHEKPESAIFDPNSSFYQNEELWTYGWICALLKYCSLDENQQSCMIRFEKTLEFPVSKCDRKTVDAVRDEMVAENKLLPFFILDEMEVKEGKRNKATFQVNVFRTCRLVLVAMGKDPQLSTLIDQSNEKQAWMTLVPRFPLYRLNPFETSTKQAAWDQMEQQYPIVKRIAEGSRGGFATAFVQSVVRYARYHTDWNLPDLLDYALGEVGTEMRDEKKFMDNETGRNAHLKAISYALKSPETSESAMTQMVEVEAEAMRVHFAHFADDKLTDVTSCDGISSVHGQVWVPRCSFPIMDEDLLLYLAILGGKPFSGYTRSSYMLHVSASDCISTWQMFMMYQGGKGFATDEVAVPENIFNSYDNAVAHMIFCASRRNGVQGISLNDFFNGLLGEFQRYFRTMTMTEAGTESKVTVNDLLEGYTALEISNTKIPFLSPPNAKWPEFILAANENGCNFGHLTRTSDKVHVQDSKGEVLLTCDCKHGTETMDSIMMREIIGGLNAVWEEKWCDFRGRERWAIALVFCSELEDFTWEHPGVGCIKINCQNCMLDWISQPKRGKLVIVMETGSLPMTIVEEMDEHVLYSSDEG